MGLCHGSDMNKSSIDLEQAKNIQEALHRLVASPCFSNSSFLKLIHQQIKKLSDEFDATMQEVYCSQSETIEETRRDISSMELVYLSLYCSEGQNLASWKRVIENLPKQYISRPIYSKEADVQKALKVRPQFSNEAYVAIYVEKKLISQPENPLFPLKDKWGHLLVTLKDKAIHLENIEYFWHRSKQYVFSPEGLIFLRDVPDLFDEE